MAMYCEFEGRGLGVEPDADRCTYRQPTKSYCFSNGNIKSVAPKLFTISISIKMVLSLK